MACGPWPRFQALQAAAAVSAAADISADMSGGRRGAVACPGFAGGRRGHRLHGAGKHAPQAPISGYMVRGRGGAEQVTP